MQLLAIAFTMAATAIATPSPDPLPAEPGPEKRLEALSEATWNAYLELHPRLATRVGDHRFDDQFGDGISDEWRRRMSRLARRTVAAAVQIDPTGLDDDERLNRRLLIGWMQRELETLDFPEHLLVVGPLPASPPIAFGQELSGAGPFRFRDVADYTAFLARMVGFVAWVDVAVEGLEEGADRGVVAPCVVVDRTLEQLDRQLTNGARRGRFLAPVRSMPSSIPADERERIAARWERTLDHAVLPAYRKLRRAVAEISRPACRDSLSMRSLPDGGRWYRMRARVFTSTDTPPEVLLRLGLEECRRIGRELEGLARRERRRSRSRADGALEGEREVFARFETIRRRVESRLPIAFGRLPRAELVIRPMDAVLAAAGPGAVYQPPEPVSGRPGVFLVDTSWPASRIRSIEALFLHEGLPGHHLQLSLTAENRELPAFRRFLYQGAFIEGWALYAEGLGGLLGLYADPVQQAGRLEQQLRRAARVVGDVGLHHLGWSRAEAERVLRDVASGINLGELERYATMPGQGLAYTVGERAFVRLRDRAHARLGGSFDLKAFHDEVLRHGALPLPVLEDVVDRWIESNLPAPRPDPSATPADRR